MKSKWNILLPVTMMLVFAATRWPGIMPPAFSAAYALTFCAGVYFPGKMAWWLPLGTLFATDLVLNSFYYHTDLFGFYALVNYASYAVIIFLGRKFSHRASWLSLLGGGISGAMLFYLITNTVAWIQIPEYAKTIAGWIQALTIGTPGWPHTWEFFRNTLLSGGLFTALFSGVMKLSEAAEEEEDEETETDVDAEESSPEQSQA